MSSALMFGAAGGERLTKNQARSLIGRAVPC